MDSVCVIGAGVMGMGVAQNLATVNINVILVDKSEEILEKSREGIYRNIRMQSFMNKGMNIDPDTILSKIEFTTDYMKMKDVDYVIENVTEKWEVKEKVYLQIDDICQKNCIFLVNTSCISITKIANVTKRADKVIGTHFMNPVPMKSTIEVIRGYHTSDETIEITKKLLAKMGKELVLVNDFPGFVSNRLSHLLMNEAAYVVQDQVASPQDIDDIFKKCYGHKMGPLETADLIGLDTIVNSLDVLFESYQDMKFRCCPLLRKMVDAGLYGMKSGEGFYTYMPKT